MTVFVFVFEVMVMVVIVAVAMPEAATTLPSCTRRPSRHFHPVLLPLLFDLGWTPLGMQTMSGLRRECDCLTCTPLPASRHLAFLFTVVNLGC